MPVYVDQPRGHAQYCAWHSTGTINGVTVQIGFSFKLDGDPGCDPASPNAALGNVSGHELSEMMTDQQQEVGGSSPPSSISVQAVSAAQLAARRRSGE